MRFPRSTVVLLTTAILLVAGSVHAAPAWKNPMTVATPPNPTWPQFNGPQVVLDSKGNATAAWSECFELMMPPGPPPPMPMCGEWGIRVSTRRGMFGRPWTTPKTLTSHTYLSAPEIAVDGKGKVYVVWANSLDPSNPIIRISSRALGGPWSAAKNVSAPGASSTLPSIAVDARGDVVVAWQQGSSTTATVKYRTRSTGQPWSAIKKAAVAGESATSPEVDMNRNGAATIIYAGTGENDDYFVHTRTRQTRSGAFGPSKTIAGPSNNFGTFSSIDVAVDNSRNILASWTRVAGSIYSLQARQRRFGNPWSPVRDVDQSGTSIYSLGGLMDVSSSGRAAFVWRDGAGALLGSKRPTLGNWTDPAPLPTVGGESNFHRALEVGSNGRVLATWEGQAGSFRPIRAAISSATAPGWGPSTEVTPTDEAATTGNAAMDPRGNALVGSLKNNTYLFQVIPYDAAGPFMRGLRIPRSGRVDRLVRFSVDPYDVWTGLAGNTQWRFGDGVGAGGNNVAYTYNRTGTFTVKVTRADNLGNRTTVRRRIRITN